MYSPLTICAILLLPDECVGHTVSKEELREAVHTLTPSLAQPWPSDDDVKNAFRVFDPEGLGFIKVTLLKRFLVQAQLGVADSVCEWEGLPCLLYELVLITSLLHRAVESLIRENCHIDGDDLINYEGVYILIIYIMLLCCH